jgi:hypothetical protein
LLKSFLLSAYYLDKYCKIYAYRIISCFRLIFFIMKYNYTLTVHYRTSLVLIANTFLKKLCDLSFAYSVHINSGTFIAEMMVWKEKFVMNIQNLKIAGKRKNKKIIKQGA